MIINVFADLLFLLFLALIGWLLFKLLSLPMPALLGAICGIVIARLLEIPLPDPTEQFFPAMQIILGLIIGSKIKLDVIHKLRELIIPSLIICSWVIFTAWLLGIIMTQLGAIDFITAFLGAVPGGISEISVIALSLEADISTIMILQFSRVFITVALISIMVSTNSKIPSPRMFIGGIKNNFSELANVSVILKNKLHSHREDNNRNYSLWLYVKKHSINLLVATSGGILGYYSGFPAGIMIGSIIAVIIFSILGFIEDPPGFLKIFVQLGIGIIIGLNFYPESVIIDGIAVLILTMLVIMLGSSFIIALLIKKITGWDYNLCVLCTAPAGLQAMILLADAFYDGNDTVKVSVIQLSRVVTIKLIIFIFALWAI